MKTGDEAMAGCAERPFRWMIVDGDGVACGDSVAYATEDAAARAMEQHVDAVVPPRRFIVREERDFDADGARNLYYHDYELRVVGGRLEFVRARSRHVGTRKDVAGREVALFLLGFLALGGLLLAVLWLLGVR